MKQLSRRQQSILEFIEAFTDERSYPPTIREIQEGLSISFDKRRRLQPERARTTQRDPA